MLNPSRLQAAYTLDNEGKITEVTTNTLNVEGLQLCEWRVDLSPGDGVLA